MSAGIRNGDFTYSGSATGLVKTSEGHRLLNITESPEAWLEDFGEGKLVEGKAQVKLDPLFLETVTVNAEYPMKVFIQLRDDCQGTYVRTSDTGFDVFELQRGVSNASFSYRVVAKRKGYEAARFVETKTGYDSANLYPELRAEIEKEHQEQRQKQELERERHQQEEVRRQEEERRLEAERQHEREQLRQREERRPSMEGHLPDEELPPIGAWETGSVQ
jgi:hypothetical protein